MSFKNSYLELCQSSCLVQQNHLCNFEKGHHGEYSFQVKMEFGPVVQKMSRFKDISYLEL